MTASTKIPRLQEGSGLESDAMRTTKSTTLLNYDSIRGLPRTAVYTDRNVSVAAERSGISYSTRKAWKELKLTAVLAVDNLPTVYFTEVSNKDLEHEAKLHRKLWNQGTANILVVVDPSEVRLYSAFVLPTNNAINDQDESDRRRIKTLELSAFILQDFALQITTGTYYRERPDYFDPKNTVNTSLLSNLTVAAGKLQKTKQPLKAKQAHILLGRLLFLFYLWDRKIITQGTFQNKLKFSVDMVDLRQFIAGDDVSAETALQRLFFVFKSIQDIFNGSLFGDDLEEAEKVIKTNHIEILQSLIMGKIEMETEQHCLFPMYDFEMIPVEMISSIYENFLLNENPNGQKDKGAFYTPRYLAELTVDVATEGWKTLLDKKYLDPACGSGIFLVILFNRIADEWRNRNPNARDKTRLIVLRNVLINNLYGVDDSETATQITCFSLYLAFLNQMEPKDVGELQELLDEKNRQTESGKKLREKILPKLIGKTIWSKNFFAADLTLNQPFDLIIGNPPWTGRNHPIDMEYKRWVNSKRCPFTEKYGQGKKYIDSVFFPNHQTIPGFLWKSLCHITDSAKACFLVPTKTLTNKHMNDFQKAWLSEAMIERIVQLADYRFILFENAICPTTIIRFNNSERRDDNLIIHDTPKVEQGDPRQSFITISAEDQKVIRQENMRAAAERGRIGSAWKKLFWGTDRDFRLITRLESLASGKTLQDVIGEKRWNSGQGFKPFYQEKYDANPKKYGEPKPRRQPDSYRYIDANDKKSLDLVLLEQDTPPIGKRFKQLNCYPKKQEIFEAPLVLVNQGFTRFVYVDFPVLFQDALQSITCTCNDTEENKKLLLFLCGVLNTPLPQYYCFHTSANQGVERDKVQFYELKRLPFPLPDDFVDSDKKWEVVQKVADCILGVKRTLEKGGNILRRKSLVGKAKQKIKDYVYEYYEIAPWEAKLIEDTVHIFAKSATPSSPNSKKLHTLFTTGSEHRKAYAELLCQSINTWCLRAPLKVSASVQVAPELGLGLLTLTKSREKEGYAEGDVSHSKIAGLLQIIQQSLLVESDSHLAVQKRYVHFERDCMYMIKPLEMRYWTQTAALNDADEIFAAMFNAKFGEGQ